MSKASRLKGHCNRLVTIFELPAHQRFGCLKMMLGVFLVLFLGLAMLFGRRFRVVRASPVVGASKLARPALVASLVKVSRQTSAAKTRLRLERFSRMGNDAQSASVVDQNSEKGSPLSVVQSGAVGIGTTNPQQMMHIYNTAGAAWDLDNGTSNLTLSLNNVGQGAFNTSVAHSYFFQQAGNTILDIAASGNVGIGTTSPVGKLDVEGSGGIVLNAGNVGIGTTAPRSLLHLASGTASNVYETFTNSTSSINGFSVGVAAGGNAILWEYDNTNLILGTNNIARMSILSNGNVGIGFKNPRARRSIGAGAARTNSPLAQRTRRGFRHWKHGGRRERTASAAETGYSFRASSSKTASPPRIFGAFGGGW